MFVDPSGCWFEFIENIVAREKLKRTAHFQYPWVYILYGHRYTGLALNIRIENSINLIVANKNTINNVSEKYGVPSEIIGGIIYKEMLTQSIPDFLANIDTLWGTKENHSTGLGAIFPGTARAAWDLFDKEKLAGIDDKELQLKLTSDNEFNIETIAVVLLYMAKDREQIFDVKDMSQILELTLDNWKIAVARYNGTTEKSEEYAEKVFEYLENIRELLD